jgi:uncharacterized integral membrane protein
MPAFRRRAAPKSIPASQVSDQTGVHPIPSQDRVDSSEAIIPSTRTASAWFSLAAVMVLLVCALVFILQNLQSVKVSFLTLHWRIPLGIDLLFAAILGGLIVFAAGSLRILQLRRLARRHARQPPAEPKR